jgi:hypothetical protein
MPCSTFKGVAPPEYTMMHIYRGIMPFVMLQLVGWRSWSIPGSDHMAAGAVFRRLIQGGH